MTLLIINQHWFSSWLSAVIWTYIAQYLWGYMASLGYNEIPGFSGWWVMYLMWNCPLMSLDLINGKSTLAQVMALMFDWQLFKTLMSEQKGHNFADNIFKSIFRFPRILFLGFSWQSISIESGYGLVPWGKEAITWISVAQGLWNHHMAMLSLNELNNSKELQRIWICVVSIVPADGLAPDHLQTWWLCSNCRYLFLQIFVINV